MYCLISGKNILYFFGSFSEVYQKPSFFFLQFDIIKFGHLQENYL